MAKYRPDIKPPMWGPPDAVRYAVRVNAERLGVDPANIGAVWPMWEGAGGLVECMTGAESTTTGLTWSGSDAIVLTSAISTTPVAAKISSKLTVFGVIENPDNGVDGGILDTKGGSDNWASSIGWSFNTRNILTRSGGLLVKIGTSETFFDTSALNDGKIHTVGAEWVASTMCDLYVDGQKPSSYVAKNIASGFTSPATYKLWSYYNDAISERRFSGKAKILCVINDWTSDLVAQLHATPYALLMPVSRPVYFDLGAGGGSYTETLGTLITSISSAADRQAYRDTVDTLITSGATVDAVTGMVEALLSLGVSASTAADVQGYADGVSDTIVSAGDAADAQDYVDGPATTGVSSSDESDTQAYTDTLADTLVSASNVTETTGTPPISESLLTTAVSASNVSAAQAYVETVTALAVAASSIGEVLGLVERIGTVGESVSSVSDRQLYYDNVAIVAISSSSLAEIGAYIEQVSAAAVSASSLTDVLVSSFVGRYVFPDYCRPRSFADYARPRSFADYCRPRGRTLQ